MGGILLPSIQRVPNVRLHHGEPGGIVVFSRLVCSSKHEAPPGKPVVLLRRIHRQIGMSGGLFVNALLRETGHTVSTEEAERLQQLHGEAFKRYAGQVRPLPGADEW